MSEREIKNDLEVIDKMVKSIKRRMKRYKSDNEHLDTVKDVVECYNKESLSGGAKDCKISEGNDKITIMLDFDDRTSRVLIMGSDLSKRLNEAGFNIVAIDHQKHDHRYRVWVEWEGSC